MTDFEYFPLRKYTGRVVSCYASILYVESIYNSILQYFYITYSFFMGFHCKIVITINILYWKDFLESPGSISYFNAYELGFCFQQDDVEVAFYHPNGNSKT